MAITYISYPTSAIPVRLDPKCAHIQARQKRNQRTAQISLSNLSSELARFVAKEYQFGGTSEINNMWVEIDSGDREYDQAVVDFIRRTLGKRYKRIRESRIHYCRCAKT